jgi:hypothetical protein
MLKVETIHICGSNIEGDLEFKELEVFIIHKFKPHGRKFG